MNKSKVLLFLIALIFINSTFLHAQKVDSLFPKFNVPARPEKTTKSASLNNFVAQSFQLAENVAMIRGDLQSTFQTVVDGRIDSLRMLETKFKRSSASLQNLLPILQNLITTSPDLLSRAKKEISIFQLPSAISNFNAALQALRGSFKEGSLLISRTLPTMAGFFSTATTSGSDSAKTIQQ